jgi:hypothetical protein
MASVLPEVLAKESAAKRPLIRDAGTEKEAELH